MVATVSDSFKRDILKEIYDSYLNIGKTAGTDSDRYYLGIGRAQDWDSTATTGELNPPVPNPSRDDALKFQESLQSLKLVPDVSYVIPRHNWIAGTVYEQWDNYYNSNTTIRADGEIQQSYYVITDDNSVFVCLQQGMDVDGNPNTSTVKPATTTGLPFSDPNDGYVWQFLFTVGATETRKFLTSAYIPVEKIIDSADGGPATDELTTTRANQLAIQKASVDGQIIGVAVENGGSGYAASTTIGLSIFGENIRDRNLGWRTNSGDSAQGFAKTNASGVVYQVVMKDSASAPYFTFGKNYKNASVELNPDSVGTGSGCVLRAIIDGDSGMGANPVVNLNSSAIMFNATLTGVENDDFQVSNDFRQVGLIKNPLKDSAELVDFTGDSVVSSLTAQVYKKLYVQGTSSFAANLTGDQIVRQTNTNAEGILNYFDATYDSVTAVAYIHQTRSTGFKRFNGTDNIEFYEGTSPLGTGTIVPNDSAGNIRAPHLRPAEADRFSGEVIYIDNRVKITRDDEQTEDVKIVIDL